MIFGTTGTSCTTCLNLLTTGHRPERQVIFQIWICCNSAGYREEGPAGIERESRFTQDEKRTHFTLWCIAKSPLFFGGDLTVIDSFTLSVINNKEVIAVNQLGTDARQLYRTNNLVVWVSNMKDSKTWNVAFFNLTDKKSNINIKLSDLGIAGKAAVRDLWVNNKLRKWKKEFSSPVNSHGACLFQVTQ